MAHAYALDFFTWYVENVQSYRSASLLTCLSRPGLRERLMFSPHAYCSNAFWRLHNTHLKILWQYDFRDCYTVNRHNGKYHLSKAFEERIGDINAWTMQAEFFKQWPELYGDIPSYESITIPLSGLGSAFNDAGNGGTQQALPAATAPQIKEIDDDKPTSPLSHESDVSTANDEAQQTTNTHTSPETLYHYTLGMPQVTNIVEPMEEDAPGEDEIYLPMFDEQLLSTLPPPISKGWDMRAAEPIPDPDWLWLSGLNPGLQEPA